MFVNINLLGFCCCILEFVRAPPTPPSLEYFLRAREKAQGFVLLFCGVVAARCGGKMARPPPSASAGPSGGARLCGRRRLGKVGCGSHPAGGASAFLAHRGSSVAPSSPPGRGGGGGELSNWRAFHLFVFTVINPSPRCCERGSRQRGGRGAEDRAEKGGRDSGLCRFQGTLLP